MTHRPLLIALLLLLYGARPVAQSGSEPVREVVTKTIEDSYPYRNGTELAVEGEKAEIFVETWDRDRVSVRVVMTARHAKLETARAELDNLELVTELGGPKIFIRNRRRDPDHRSESELSVHYYITLPEACPVYLRSHFGGATISNLRNQLRINGEFSAINIDNVQGLLDIRTRFGDVTGERIDGNVVINARRSDISLFDVGGTFTINAKYGKLNLSPNAGMRNLQVNADKSDVTIYEPAGGEGLAYELAATNGNLNLPDNRRFRILERTEERRRVQIGSASERMGTVTASVTFGDLTLSRQRRELESRSRF